MAWFDKLSSPSSAAYLKGFSPRDALNLKGSIFLIHLLFLRFLPVPVIITIAPSTIPTSASTFTPCSVSSVSFSISYLVIERAAAIFVKHLVKCYRLNPALQSSNAHFACFFFLTMNCCFDSFTISSIFLTFVLAMLMYFFWLTYLFLCLFVFQLYILISFLKHILSSLFSGFFSNFTFVIANK